MNSKAYRIKFLKVSVGFVLVLKTLKFSTDSLMIINYGLGLSFNLLFFSFIDILMKCLYILNTEDNIKSLGTLVEVRNVKNFLKIQSYTNVIIHILIFSLFSNLILHQRVLFQSLLLQTLILSVGLVLYTFIKKYLSETIHSLLFVSLISILRLILAF